MNFIDKIELFLNELKLKYNSNFNVEEDQGSFKILMDNRNLCESSKFRKDSIELLIQNFSDEALNMYFVYDHLGKMKEKDRVYDLILDNTVFKNTNNNYINESVSVFSHKENFNKKNQKWYKNFKNRYLLAA